MTHSPKDTPPPVETLTVEEIARAQHTIEERLPGWIWKFEHIFAAAREAVIAREKNRDPNKCLRCGYPRSEHHYNGACYGLCGEFVAPASSPEREAIREGRMEGHAERPQGSSCARAQVRNTVPSGQALIAGTQALPLSDCPSPTQPRLSQDDEELVKRAKEYGNDPVCIGALDIILRLVERIQSLSARAQRAEEALKDKTGTKAFMLELKWRDDSIEALNQIISGWRNDYETVCAELSFCRSECEGLRAKLQAPKLSQQADIITARVNPPIPLREFDWSACRNGYEPGCPIGWGKTEQEAIGELLAIEQERFDGHQKS